MAARKKHFLIEGICVRCRKPFARLVSNKSRNVKFCSRVCQKSENRIQCAYNITFEDINKMLEEQEYKCAICKKDIIDLESRDVNIDHCHRTGKVRGLLCRPCNSGIGHLQDDVNIVKSAAKYLEKHGSGS